MPPSGCTRASSFRGRPPPSFHVAEEAQKVAGHPVAGMTRLEPDPDVVVVGDVEHQSSFPTSEADGRQTEETEQLCYGDDRSLVGRARSLSQGSQ
eukprot:1039944-Heterocapsa_arctica.AAC.1